MEDTLRWPTEPAARSSAPSLENVRSSEYESKKKKESQHDNHPPWAGLCHSQCTVIFLLIIKNKRLPSFYSREPGGRIALDSLLFGGGTGKWEFKSDCCNVWKATLSSSSSTLWCESTFFEHSCLCWCLCKPNVALSDLSDPKRKKVTLHILFSLFSFLSSHTQCVAYKGYYKAKKN